MYRIQRSNGDFFASIPDNVILGPNIPSASPTPLNLVGRNKVSYGQAQNENFVWLLENFANTSAPAYPLRGQLWYDYTNDDGVSGGELKIAPYDNIDISQWITVPVISSVTTEPSDAYPGRMIIYKDNNLKIRMNNQWYQISTTTQTETYSGQLDILYTNDVYLNSFTTVPLKGSVDTTLARFNKGGYLDTDGSLGGIDEGILRYASSYFWEAEIIARSASDETLFKVWRLTGGCSIDSKLSQAKTATPDPRKITPFTSDKVQKTVLYQTAGTENWSCSVVADTIAPAPTLSISEILTGSYYGLLFKGNANNTNSNYVIDTIWNINFSISGLNSSLNSKYKSI